MTLADYLKEQREAVNAFADRIGVSRNTIRKIVYRQRQPSLALAQDICRHTDGAVQMDDLVIRPIRTEG